MKKHDLTDEEIKEFHEDKPCAILTLKNASEMHPDTRKFIASWLRRMGRDLIKNGDNYAPVYRGRYFRMNWK